MTPRADVRALVRSAGSSFAGTPAAQSESRCEAHRRSCPDTAENAASARRWTSPDPARARTTTRPIWFPPGSVHVVEPTHHVEEERADEDQAVDAIQQPAMARNQRAHVLYADVPLDHADREISELPADADDNTRQDELQRSEMGEAESQEPGERHRDGQRPERSAPGLVGTDLGSELASPEQLSREKRRDVAPLDGENQKQQIAVRVRRVRQER